jgi:hypothetical protein
MSSARFIATQLASIEAGENATPGTWAVWRGAPPGVTYGGLALDAGEVFALTGQPGDASLMRTRTAEPLGARTGVLCGADACGRSFVSSEHAVRHALRAHPRVAEPAPPASVAPESASTRTRRAEAEGPAPRSASGSRRAGGAS